MPKHLRLVVSKIITINPYSVMVFDKNDLLTLFQITVIFEPITILIK
jgi:hypothetical protein